MNIFKDYLLVMFKKFYRDFDSRLARNFEKLKGFYKLGVRRIHHYLSAPSARRRRE